MGNIEKYKRILLRNRFLKRLYLFLKPAYWHLRTDEQRRFDRRLQFIFAGCFLAILFLLILVFSLRSCIAPRTEEDIPAPSTEPVQEKEYLEDVQLYMETANKKVITLEMQLDKNETLSGLLKRANLSMKEALAVSGSLSIVTDLRKLRPGQAFELFFLEDNSFQGIKFEDRKGDIIGTFKDSDGDFVPQSREGKIQIHRYSAGGLILTTFSEAAKEASVPSSIIRQVTNALDGEINFKTDLKKGEPFQIIYEQKKTETGKDVGSPQLLYVSLTTQRDTYQRYYFVDGSGSASFYNEFGEKSPQTLLKRPLGTGRISSYFGVRKHPILGHEIHHSGVDFPAPTGTAVPAAADGVITHIGRNGAYGKYIRIRHNDTYSTAYAHLNDYNPTLRIGVHVKKGQVIAYVGSTGRSTGPHLHYEVLKNGKQVNPLNTYTLPKKTLKNEALNAFVEKAKKINPDFRDPRLLSKDEIQARQQSTPSVSEDKNSSVEAQEKPTQVQEKQTKMTPIVPKKKPKRQKEQ